MAVHVRGPLAHIKHAAPAMRKAGRGSIVNIGSIAGHRAGYSSSMIYAVAKAAVIHLTRCAAMELGEDGVRVNSVSPGVIATGIFGKAMGMDDEAAERTVERAKALMPSMQAIPRAGVTDDIAAAALFLASDEAGFVNGEDIVVDGGLIWGRRASEVAKAGIWAKLRE
jgi:NAD(P)-dependent dehydrogenase (short-subunit alcohol dehydrogenase family)